VGYWKNAKPTPETLARADQLTGGRVVLADGGEWLVPRLRIFSTGEGFVSCLPCFPGLSEAGEWIQGKHSEAHEKLNAICDRLIEGMIFTTIEGEEIPELTVAEGLDAATAILQANYFISKVELVAMQALDSEHFLGRVLKYATDQETALEWGLKKNAARESAAAVGSPV
jgi:hypothetical protein